MRKPAAVILVSLVAVLALVLMPSALAAKGGNKASGGGKPSAGTLNLVLMDGATEARHMGRVTFEVSTTATDRPFVGLRCWQGSSFVYDGYVGYFDDYLYDTDWFTLDSPYWTAGVPATCTARLFAYDRRGNQKVLTTLDFPVAP